MTLKNASSTSKNTFPNIEKVLTSHKVQSISFRYSSDGSGRIEAIEFMIPINGTPFSFRLPARIENVEKVMYPRRTLTKLQKEQAYRTAWANVLLWITAQMAMLDIGMVTAEEVFLPYMLNRDGQTFYETMKEAQFSLPAAGTTISEVK